MTTIRYMISTLLLVGSPTLLRAQEIVSKPFPSPSSNAAMHYNRAMLSLPMVDSDKRELLRKPIWTEIRALSDDELAAKLTDLIFANRNVLRAALLGAQQNEADFGIDYADFGLGALPHVGPMLEIGRLVTLAGLDAQRHGDWRKAGLLFFQGLRMGYHMTHQPTLAEALTGVEILENNYFALANFSLRCPDEKLLQRVFTMFEVLSEDLVSPANTLVREALVISHRCDKIKAAFPDGPWAEMLLESLGQYEEAASRKAMEAKAIEICVARGVPKEAFAEKAAFDAQVSKIQNLWVTCFEATAVSMLVPPKARVARGQRIYEYFHPQLRQLGDDGLLDPTSIGVFFALHDAEVAMARVVLALAASRTDGEFPASLSRVAAKFGGPVPTSPYDGSPINYEVTADGKDVTVAVAEVRVGDVVLPEVKFSSAGK